MRARLSFTTAAECLNHSAKGEWVETLIHFDRQVLAKADTDAAFRLFRAGDKLEEPRRCAVRHSILISAMEPTAPPIESVEINAVFTAKCGCTKPTACISFNYCQPVCRSFFPFHGIYSCSVQGRSPFSQEQRYHGILPAKRWVGLTVTFP